MAKNGLVEEESTNNNIKHERINITVNLGNAVIIYFKKMNN